MTGPIEAKPQRYVGNSKLVTWNNQKGKFVNQNFLKQIFHRLASLTSSRSFEQRVKESINQAFFDYTQAMYTANRSPLERATPLYERLVSLTDSDQAGRLQHLNATGVDQFLRSAFQAEKEQKTAQLQEIMTKGSEIKNKAVAEAETINLARKLLVATASSNRKNNYQTLVDEGRKLNSESNSLLDVLGTNNNNQLRKIDKIQQSKNLFDLHKVFIDNQVQYLADEQQARTGRSNSFVTEVLAEGKKQAQQLQQFIAKPDSKKISNLSSALKEVGYQPRKKYSDHQLQALGQKALRLVNSWIDLLAQQKRDLQPQSQSEKTFPAATLPADPDSASYLPPADETTSLAAQTAPKPLRFRADQAIGFHEPAQLSAKQTTKQQLLAKDLNQAKDLAKRLTMLRGYLVDQLKTYKTTLIKLASYELPSAPRKEVANDLTEQGDDLLELFSKNSEQLKKIIQNKQTELTNLSVSEKNAPPQKNDEISFFEQTDLIELSSDVLNELADQIADSKIQLSEKIFQSQQKIKAGRAKRTR